MEIRWFGTASVEIRSESGHILFDPFVPLAGSDVNVKLEDFDGCTAIFVTHGHFDHIVNIPEIQKRNPGARIYCTKTPYHTLAKKCVPKDALRLIGFGQTVEAEGFTVRTFHGPSVHTARERGLPRKRRNGVLSRGTGRKANFAYGQPEYT